MTIGIIYIGENDMASSFQRRAARLQPADWGESAEQLGPNTYRRQLRPFDILNLRKL